MKNALLSLAALTAMSFSVSSFAQTCTSPLPIRSNTTVTGDLCAATNSLPGYGGTASPQKEIVYSFVAQGANATISMTEGAGGFTGVVYLMPSPCSSSTDPIAFGFAGAGNAMAVNNLTDGQTYYVIATADPGGPAAACGTFTSVVQGTLPVALQNFSVE